MGKDDQITAFSCHYEALTCELVFRTFFVKDILHLFFMSYSLGKKHYIQMCMRPVMPVF